MPVNLVAPVAADLHPIAGVRIGVAEAGVRKAHRKDLTAVSYTHLTLPTILLV